MRTSVKGSARVAIDLVLNEVFPARASNKSINEDGLQLLDKVLNKIIRPYLRDLTKLGEAYLIPVTSKEMDNFYDIEEYAKSLDEVNEVMIFKVDEKLIIEKYLKVLEFFYSSFRLDEGFEYCLTGVIVRKNRVFHALCRENDQVVVHKGYSRETFSSWGEAFFSAFEGGFLPYLVFYKSDQDGSLYPIEYLLDLTSDAIEAFIDLQSEVIKSTYDYY